MEKGHSTELIIQALNRVKAGEKVPGVCRKLGISQASFYTWRKQYANCGVSEFAELRQLRGENSKLKRLVADLSLGQLHPQEIVPKNCNASRSPSAGPVHFQQVYQLSERCAARLMLLDRATLGYQSYRDRQYALRHGLGKLAAARVRYGYGRLAVLLRREGWSVNTKRVYRLYTEEGLTIRTKPRQKLASRVRAPLPTVSHRHQR